MNKFLAICLAVFMAVPSSARITGTQPTNADVACWGPDGAEVCIDASGNTVPTTDNDTTSGSSSLRWATVHALDATIGDDITVADDATVTGDLFKVMVATVTMTAAATIDISGACGGILRLTSNTEFTSSTTNTFTAPSTANAGCQVDIINVGNAPILLDTNANFPMIGFPSVGNITLDTNDVITILQVGSKWVLLNTVTNY